MKSTRLGLKDLRDRRGTLGLLGLWVLRVLEVLLVLSGHRVLLVHRDSQALPGRLVPQVQRVLLARPA